MAIAYLITGATGNVGKALVAQLTLANGDTLFRATHHAATQAPDERYLDFAQPASFSTALAGISRVFLLRPPQLADVKAFFNPFIAACQQAGVQHIVFLSVQGAEKLAYIPHAKIEKLIRQSGIDYTFIRPSYFMQNLTTTFRDEIRLHHQVVIPAGRALFLWVDADDVGRASAVVLQQADRHRNQAYTITGTELLSFERVSVLLSKELAHPITYKSPNPLWYYWAKRRQGLPRGQVLIMILLHMLPRFQAVPGRSPDYAYLTGRAPRTLAEFVHQHKSEWV